MGTVRTFDPLVQEMVENRLKDLCNAIALGFGATATVHYERIYPPPSTPKVKRCLLAMWPNLWWGRTMWCATWNPAWAQRTSFMLQTKPGAYLRIGRGTGASGSALHNSRYDFNDDILPLGSAFACEPDRAGHAAAHALTQPV